MDCKTAQMKIMPYIKRQLNDRELEEFLEHIRSCETCSEELEVYFTIYYALEKLDQDEQGSYNMQEMLQKDLEYAKERIRKRNILDFYGRFLGTITAVLILILAATGIQALVMGGIEHTFVYGIISPVTETQMTDSHTKTAALVSYGDDENAEPETNRKFQVIITTPETEKMTEPIDLTKKK